MKISERMVKIETDVAYIKSELMEQKQMMRDFIECADNKFASKLTERIVQGMVVFILIAVLSAIISGVIL